MSAPTAIAARQHHWFLTADAEILLYIRSRISDAVAQGSVPDRDSIRSSNPLLQLVAFLTNNKSARRKYRKVLRERLDSLEQRTVKEKLESLKSELDSNFTDDALRRLQSHLPQPGSTPEETVASYRGLGALIARGPWPTPCAPRIFSFG
jgi:hypothetical protein